MPRTKTASKPRRRAAVERPTLPEAARREFLAAKPRAAKGTGPRGGLTTVTGQGTVRVSAYLAPEDWRRLRERGLAEGVTAAELVRQAVTAFLGR